VRNYPRPKTVAELRTLLGLLSYYRKFVKGFAAIAHPLTSLTRKDSKWVWGEEQENAFQKLKRKLITSPILRYPDFTRAFIIHCDASKFGVGSILSQIQPVIVSGIEQEARGSCLCFLAYERKRNEVEHDREGGICYFMQKNVLSLPLWTSF